MNKKKMISLGLSLIAAVILLQTLYFKFTAHPDSVHIFSELGIEPWGRIMTGIFEIIASVLILIPRTRIIGALLGAGIMGGAIVSHLFVLGIEVNSDGGKLFVLALIVMLACTALLFMNYRTLITALKGLMAKK